MDRQITYDAERPASADVLWSNRFLMNDAAFQNAAILGSPVYPNYSSFYNNGTVVEGLICTPTNPASLNVTVGVGSVYALDPVDNNAYGVLTPDAHQVFKQGILSDPVILAANPPATSGYSINYLLQASLQDVDDLSAVLSYYNSSNPLAPLPGPGGLGAAQATVRFCRCTVSLKAGAAAPTGTQTTPLPDSNAVGLATVTVVNGATQILGASITVLPTAPYFPTLPAVPPDYQNRIWRYAPDTGSVNAMAATIYPPVTQLAAGLGVFLNVANTNTGAATFNLNGLGAQPVVRGNGSALSAGDLNAGEIAMLQYDGAHWQVINFFGFSLSATNNNVVNLSIPYATDNGTVNAMVGHFAPPITSLTAGNILTIKVANTNTGVTTLQADSQSAIAVYENGLPLLPAAITAGEIIMLFYDGTVFQKVNKRWQYWAWDVSTPPPSNLNMQIGDQATITFENVTALPLNIATQPKALYRTTLIVTQSNSQYSYFFLFPNDDLTQLSGTGKWQCSPMVNTNFIGYATWGHSTFQETANPTNVMQNPVMALNGYNGGLSGFQLFDDRSAADTINNVGPFMAEITTPSSAPVMYYQGGIRGGPGHGFAWNVSGPLTYNVPPGSVLQSGLSTIGGAGLPQAPVPTPPAGYTSLGTIIVALTQSGGAPGPNNAATISGIAIVRRMA